MKELEPHQQLISTSSNRIELNVKKKQEKEYVLEGTIQPDKGHKVFEVNKETGGVKEADYNPDTATYNALAQKQPKKLIIRADCVYISALNATNAKKKYLKNSEQSFYYKKAAPMQL